MDLRRIQIWELPAGSISVKWDLPTDDGGQPITGYAVYLDGLVYFNTTEADSTLSEYVLTSLTVDREYEIVVTARNDIGEGAAATITLLAASLAPKPPMPDFESATSSSITVNASVPSYSGGTAITGFAYRRDDGPLSDFQAQVEQTTDLTAPSMAFTGLDSTTRIYRFQMAVINAIGQGDWSEAVSYRATSPPPNADQSFFLVETQTTTSITLQWTAPTVDPLSGDCDIEGYRMLLEDVLSPGYAVVYDGVRSSSTTSLTLSYPTVTPSRYYKLLLQAKNCGQVYSTGTAITVASASVPAQIVDAPVIVSYDDASSMTIGWEDPPSSGGFPVLTFTIYVDNNALATVDASKNTYQMTSLTQGQDYKIRISSTNEIGESALSLSARITFANRPSSPATLTLTSTKTPSIEASWTAPASVNGDPASGYRLYIDNALGGEYNMVFDGSFDQPATFSFVISDDIECGSIYYLEVTAVNLAGESDATLGEIWVGEPPTAPLFPRMTSIVPLDQVTFDWDFPLDTGCLPLLHHSISRDGVLLETIGPELNSYTDDTISSSSDFPMGTEIIYTIMSTNVAGDGEYSVELPITVGQEPDAPSNIVVS